jgi:hypothetical protein
MRSNIRRPLFDGMREIDAIWFDLELLGETPARGRILAHWEAGARLHRVGEGYLLTLARPRFVHCARLDGLALCKVDGILSSAPLAADEKASAPHGGCWLIRGAQARAFRLADADLVDPAQWIDLGAIVVRAPLAFPQSHRRIDLGAPDEAKSLRDILEGVIPPPSDKRAEFLRALREHADGRRAARTGGAGAMAAAAAAGAGLLARLIGKFLGGRSGPSGAPGQGAGRRAPDPAWKQRLFDLAARLAALSKLSDVIGWRQAAYLRKMVDMFERGDIAEALRHAIPLGDESADGRQALGALQARSSLEITAPGGTTPMIGLDGGMQEYLRKSYRQLFQRLEREGRIDEATFVLAELLKSGVEAVDYLERNGRLKQAAELAETLQLAPAVAVRLWLLAGDAARAINIARLHGAFAEAVLLLERKQRPEAGPLRQLWAEYLFDRGDLLEAAEAIWPLEQYRGLALEWLLQAEQAGRALGARALVRKLALMPESLAASAPAIAALLESQSDEAPALRAALATELIALGTQSSATKRLAGEVLRHVIPERSLGLNSLDTSAIEKLLAFGDAALLKSDLPPIRFDALPGAAPVSYAQRPPARVIEAEAGERGLMQIHDARRLPDGHYLVALGEGGVLRINRQGKRLVHFPLPAYHLVLAHNGERALALARRGDVIRASRIDLTTHKASDWLSHPFDSWADQYDGVVWNAVIANRIVAIDTSKDQLTVIWQVADLPGKVIDFLDDGATQTILLAGAKQLQQWRYQLPARRLCQRDVVADPPEGVSKVLAHSASPTPLLLWERRSDSGTELASRLSGAERSVMLGMTDGAIRAEIKDGALLIHTLGVDAVHTCRVFDKRADQVLAELRLPHAVHAGAAAHDGHVLLFDRAGRLIDVDLSRRTLHTLTLT